VQRPERGVGVSFLVDPDRVEQRRRRTSRAREEIRSLRLRPGGEERLEELADDAVGERALKLRPSGTEHLHPGELPTFLRFGQKCRLSDARRSLHGQESSAMHRSNGALESG
jgi:hypothetical protein